MSDEKRLNQPTVTSNESNFPATPLEPNTEQVVNPEALVLDAPLPVSQERAATDQVAQASDQSLPVTQERANTDPAAQVSALPVSQERAASDSAAQVPAIDPAPDASLPVSQEQTAPDSVAQEPVAPGSVAQAPDASVSYVTAPTVDSSEDDQLESPILSDKSEHSEPNSESITSSSDATKSSTTSSESRSKLTEPISISEQGIGSTEPSSDDSRLISLTPSAPDSSLSRTNTRDSFSTSDSAVGLGTYQPTQPSFPYSSHGVSYGYRNVGIHGAGPSSRPDWMSPQSSFESYSDATVPSLTASIAKSPPTGASLTTLTIDTSEAASAQVNSLSVEEAAPAQAVSPPPPPSSDSIETPSDRLFLRRHGRENFWIRFFFPRNRRDRCVRRGWRLIPLPCFIAAFIILFVKYYGDWPALLEVFMLVLFANSFFWIFWMCVQCATSCAEYD